MSQRPGVTAFLNGRASTTGSKPECCSRTGNEQVASVAMEAPTRLRTTAAALAAYRDFVAQLEDLSLPTVRAQLSRGGSCDETQRSAPFVAGDRSTPLIAYSGSSP
jgi:hypothetical protein